MNRLRELSSQVMDVYQSLSQEFSAYQSSRSLNCVEKCGACCNNPDIEVSPLEMLPLALHLFDTGRAEQEFDELDNYSGFACKQYQRLSLDGKEGYCGIYEYRPAICRMFGAAGYKTKSGEATLSVCKPIKQAVPEKYAAALIAIQPQHLDILEKRLVDDIAVLGFAYKRISKDLEKSKYWYTKTVEQDNAAASNIVKYFEDQKNVLNFDYWKKKLIKNR